jgi:YcdB, YcdC repeated domain
MDDSEEFNEPYYPARYRELIRKKKQRRLLKKIAMIAVMVIAVIVVVIVLGGVLSGSPQPAPSPMPTPTPTVTPLPTTVAVTTVASTMPSTAPIITTVPTTGTTIKPTTKTTVTATEIPEPIMTASANTYITPKGAGPRITEQQAKIIALAAFPSLPTGDMRVELSDSPDFGQVWKYTLRADMTIEASGLLDAETGTVVTFNRTIHPGARPQNPVLTMANARQIADSTINNRNTGILSINMSDGRYVPLVTQSGNVAGNYRFIFNRMIEDYPCDADGFIVSVDAVSGVITEYVQHWQTPDNAFNIIEEPAVPRFDATYAIEAEAKSIYPSSVSSIRIISADRRWKDRHDPASIPRPSSVPLAWKVVFDDDTIRANPNLAPGVGWVDAHTGEIIGFEYKH